MADILMPPGVSNWPHKRGVNAAAGFNADCCTINERSGSAGRPLLPTWSHLKLSNEASFLIHVYLVLWPPGERLMLNPSGPPGAPQSVSCSFTHTNLYTHSHKRAHHFQSASRVDLHQARSPHNGPAQFHWLTLAELAAFAHECKPTTNSSWLADGHAHRPPTTDATGQVTANLLNYCQHYRPDADVIWLVSGRSGFELLDKESERDRESVLTFAS